MGNSNAEQASTPQQGFRVVSLSHQIRAFHLFTDYIICPNPHEAAKKRIYSQFTVFSILDCSLRTQSIDFQEEGVSIEAPLVSINQCILRITKIFADSPCEAAGILTDEYIVGVLEGEYECLQRFAELLKRLMSENRPFLTLAVCNSTGTTRLISIATAALKDWRGKKKGILGCQLAEGWMHRFRPRQAVEINEPERDLVMTSLDSKKQLIESINVLGSGEDSLSSDEVDCKVGQLQGLEMGRTLVMNFKGVLKDEFIQDASTICKCSNYNKHCERCFLEKDGSYYFFNRKTNRIVSIDSAMLFP